MSSRCTCSPVGIFFFSFLPLPSVLARLPILPLSWNLNYSTDYTSICASWQIFGSEFKIDDIDSKGFFVNLFDKFSPLCGAPRPADRSNGLFFRRKLVQGCWLEAVQPDTVVSAAWSSSRELIVRRCKSAQCNTTQWADSRKISQSAENRDEQDLQLKVS